MTSVMYLQELKTKNTQVDKNMELGTKHVSQNINKQTTRDDFTTEHTNSDITLCSLNVDVSYLVPTSFTSLVP